MTDDLISRQAAIFAILECCDSDFADEYECGYDDGLRKAAHKLKHLPTAQPTADVVERKDLDTITEAHEQIGYEKGYRDGYAQANVVEVVRCKECKFYDFWERRGIHLCVRWSGDPYEAAEPGEDDFCSFAERRDDAET